MDPKSPLYNASMPIGEVSQVVYDWLAKGHWYTWKTEPGDVVAFLYDAIDKDGYITFHKAKEILEAAKTSKMPGSANAGMDWILEQWKVIAKKCPQTLK